MSKIVIKKPGGTVFCYGTVKWDSNFEIVCDDEANDCTIAGIDGATNWTEVVDKVINVYGITDVEQIESC